ncbi:hypothetical protein FHX81_7973 [Saccharothrix saharensis]|uniref:NYN domain-containing protein n=1 Tax=Saccharothrix saharensis TaxID=571190 RepID=A0A543JRR8_9PSEU|nr:hypothetical protein FHX81_7973 [Saccharothrix saharensis]
MRPDERVVLIDLENMVGTNPRTPVLRSKVTALLEAAGPYHHAVVAYAASEDDGDTAASVLAALGVAPLRVEPGPDAAENALIRHASRMQASGCTRFTVCSGDKAFATLADVENTRIDLLVWQGQPVATRLADIAHDIHELPRVDKTTAAGEPLSAHRRHADGVRQERLPDTVGRYRLSNFPLPVAALLMGMGVALGHRLVDVVFPRGRTPGRVPALRPGYAGGRVRDRTAPREHTE